MSEADDGTTSSPPSAPVTAGAKREQRRYPRHMVYWPVVIFHEKSADKAAILHGETCEISMGGASILSEQNFSLKSLVMMQLAIPPQLLGQKTKIIEIRCRMVHAHLDARHHMFRMGFEFIELNDKYKVILNEVLSHHTPAP
ncbi:MAG: PilZ domain-containing protein [Nitrosomonadales bacterium]|nr:MAG: PilZ domain-containing protein [Nitrosomonadales bacterium]